MNKYLFITQLERDIAGNVLILRVEIDYPPNYKRHDAILTVEQVIWLMDNGNGDIRFAIRPDNVADDFICVEKKNKTTIGLVLKENEPDYLTCLPPIVVADSEELIPFNEIAEYLLTNVKYPERLRANQIAKGNQYRRFLERIME